MTRRPVMTNKRLRAKLREIHSALDDALGDSDIEHKSLAELRETAPTQWAATKLALLIDELEPLRPES